MIPQMITELPDESLFGIERLRRQLEESKNDPNFNDILISKILEVSRLSELARINFNQAIQQLINQNFTEFRRTHGVEKPLFPLGESLFFPKANVRLDIESRAYDIDNKEWVYKLCNDLWLTESKLSSYIDMLKRAGNEATQD